MKLKFSQLKHTGEKKRKKRNAKARAKNKFNAKFKPVITIAEQKHKARNKIQKTYHRETLEDTGNNTGW